MSKTGASQSQVSLVHKHDGHHEGYLNCLAIRHGWTRTFSISPQELESFDYATLERVLELPTLKLRPLGLRVFVENPVASGTFAKVRFWKDDGSLQSVLVQEFFKARCANGDITAFELRDGKERSGGVLDGDETGAESIGTPGSGFSRLRSKFRSASDGSTPQSEGRRRSGFFDFFKLPQALRPAPPSSDLPLAAHAHAAMGDIESDDEGEIVQRPPDDVEQELLRKRGWMPPIFRRGTSNSGTGLRRRKSNKRDEDGNEDGTKKASKQKGKGKGKARASFQGAERIARPEDALPAPTPTGSGRGSHDPFEDQD